MSVAGPINSPVNPTASEAPGRRARISRRAVLGVAAAGGAGMAAIRLLGLDRALTAPSTGGRLDWNSPLGSETARVAHLLRRNTFGAAAEELDAAASAGFSKTVDRLVETPPAEPPALPAAAVRDGYGLNVPELQLWWLQHMLASPTPFAERITLFMHGHFTSDYQKVGVQTPYLHWQNLTWRRMAFTDLRSALLKVTADPAMLRYLDLGQSTGKAPNENYSRELMEVFTMGAGQFHEADVRGGAKALAGWVEPKPDRVIDVTLDAKNNVTRKYPVWDAPAEGRVDPRRAYTGSDITFLGKTGKLDSEGVIDAILAQPVTAVYITTKLLSDFGMANPPDAWVKRLAGQFRSSKYDFKTLYAAVFKSPEFIAPAAYRSLVKNPTELMVHALKTLKAPQLARLAVTAGPGMGQQLFNPPDVGGWPKNDSWISSNDVVARVNFVTTLLGQVKNPPPATDAHQHQLDGVLSPQTANLLGQATDDKTRWLLTLASPEFQLK